MKKLNIAFLLIAIVLAGFGPWHLAAAQNAPSASLADHLKEQYKLTKIGSDSSGLAIVEPGTVFVIRKGGILGVPPASLTIAPATYKDGDLHPPNVAVGNHTRLLSVGEKVYITKIDVNLKYDKVAVTIIECDSCNGAQKPSFYKSMVVFQFPKDYLTAAEAEQIEDVISQVLSQSSPADLTPPGNQPAASAQSLTNDDIIKLVQAKLPDSVVIAKIKSSSSELDTSPDALIKLKQAGVSDSVLQAIVDAQPAPNEEAAPPDPSALSFSSLSQYVNTRWPDRAQCREKSIAIILQRLQNAGYRTTTDLDTALSNGSQKLAEAEAQVLYGGGIYSRCGLVIVTLQATDPKFRAAPEEAAAAPSPEPQPDSAPVTPTGNPATGSYAAALHDGNPALVFAVDPNRTFAVDLVDHHGERALRLRVAHNHMSNCTGYLYISHTRISYDAVETPNFQKDAFDLPRGEIKKATITKFAFGGHLTVGIWTEKKNYFFLPLFDPGAGNKAGIRQAFQDRVRAEAVYEFIGRSLNDFDSVLHEAETVTASLTQRP